MSLRLNVVAALAFLYVTAAAAQEPMVPQPLTQEPLTQEPVAGTLDFCPRPVKPACVEDDATYAQPASRKACDEEVTRYVTATFNFRNCMAVQLENVIRDTNRLSERFKCKSEGKRSCG